MRFPAAPKFSRTARREVFTAAEARRIILAHGGRPVTVVEKEKLIAAGLWGMPKE